MLLNHKTSKVKLIDRAERRGMRARNLVLLLGLGYLAIAVAAWVLVANGDRWWPSTVLLFGPRWVLLAPLALLLPAALWWSRWAVLPLGFAAMIVAWPVMGLCVSKIGAKSAEIAEGETSAASAERVRMITFNVQYSDEAYALLGDIAERTKADVITLQECPQETPAWVTEGKWNVCWQHGLCVLSRGALKETGQLSRRPLGGWGLASLACSVESAAGGISVASVHLMSPRDGLEALISQRLEGIDAVRSNTADRARYSAAASEFVHKLPGPVLIGGDFNMPVESRFYKSDWPEYANAFSETGRGYGHTKFTRWHGARIDHVLADRHWRVLRCGVAADIGSDHRPVFAELERIP